MAQQFQVLRCCFCHIFQVQQVKKSKKWNCKICNEKQSVLKVFGQGSGSDCRHHVQKLNLLLGEREQAPSNMSWHAEEPEEKDNKNAVVQLEKNLDWQEEKVSRWNKYLDKSCKKEDEEKMLHTENQTYSSLKNIANNPRKHKKTSLDAQTAEESGVPQSGNNHRRNSFRDAQAHENVQESMGIPAVEELLVHGKNEDPELQNSVISNWKKSFSSETFKGSMVSTVLEGQASAVQRSSPAAGDEVIANFIDSPPNWQHIPGQTASVFLDNVQKDSECIEEANILIEKRDSSILPSSNLQKMLSKVPTTIYSVHPPAFSSATGHYSSLFSTGDDFDDYL